MKCINKIKMLRSSTVGHIVHSTKITLSLITLNNKTLNSMKVTKEIKWVYWQRCYYCGVLFLLGIAQWTMTYYEGDCQCCQWTTGKLLVPKLPAPDQAVLGILSAARGRAFTKTVKLLAFLHFRQILTVGCFS